MAACGTDSTSPSTGSVTQFFRGSTQTPESTATNAGTAAAETITVGCPAVSILPDTESLRRLDASGDEEALRWQASITKTARECTKISDGVSIRVGVAGRVVEGVKGAPDQVELPLRIAVREGGEVTYSRLHNVQVSLAGAASQSWAFVDDTVKVDEPGRAEIIVGFDGG
ncbi:MAG: hypothetical protein AAGD34_17725 [Pseudomonadota bacterium]